MAKIVSEKQVNTFVKGLITEASPLTFPENASIDEKNFVLELNGSRSRRLGIDYESGYAFKNTGLSDAAMAATKVSMVSWLFPGGSTTVVLGVIRIDTKLYFINLLHASPSSAAAIKNSGNALTIPFLATEDLQFTTINNYLVITPAEGKANSPIILSYNKDTDVVTQDYINVQIRDFYGVYENVQVDNRPSTLTDTHNYNLQNQGWNNKMLTNCGVSVNPIQCTYNTVNTVTGSVAGYPSNADIMSLGKGGDSTNAATYQVFSPAILYKNSLETIQSPKGHFIIDAFTRGGDITNTDFRAIAYNGSLYVAVTDAPSDHQVYTSPDGITWSSRNTPVVASWQAITVGTSGFVAVASDSHPTQVMTSPDGITWTARTTPSNEYWFGVAWNGSVYAAVGATLTSNNVMTSPDGITWTLRSGAANRTWAAIARNNSVFVAVNHSGITTESVMTSPDGITWTLRTVPAAVAAARLDNIVYNGTIFAAVGDGGHPTQAATSPDGITWTARTTPVDSNWSNIAWNGTTFVSLSKSDSGIPSRGMTSPDGITWTQVANIPSGAWTDIADSTESTSNSPLFVAVSSYLSSFDGDSPVLTSSNGVNWATRDVYAYTDSRANLTNLLNIPTDFETGRITTIAAYAGRVFYSGIISNIIEGDQNSPNLSTYVLFSQLVSNKESLGKCYQENDPTSPDISDILDTDGGTIHIPEASKIVKLVPHGSSLLVFAENGVWQITGENGVFKATSYQVNKVTSIGTEGTNSIIEGGSSLFYWTNSGIYVIIPDPATGNLGVQSVSISTIQSFMNTISATAKKYAKAMYDERNNTIRWLYNDTAAYSTTNYINKYNKQLNLNLTLQSFYVYDLGDTSATTLPYVADFIKIPNYSPSAANSRVEPYSLLTIKNGTFTISKYSSTRFKDWYTNDSTGVNYSSYLVTGYEYAGDILREKQVPYIQFYFTRTEDGFTLVGSDLMINNPSGCLVQAQWNWTNSANSGKWGAQFQAYRFTRNYIPSGASDTFDYGDSVIVTKNKLRGSGKVLSLKIQSETGKDMKLLGWGMMITGKSEI